MPVPAAMEYNFNDLLDDMLPPGDLPPPERKETEPDAFRVRPQRFAMGSAQGHIFREGFGRCVDYAVLSLNFQKQSLFFRIPFDDAPLPLPILQGYCPIDDLQSVRLVKKDRKATMTVTMRRPPRIEADFRRMHETDPDSVPEGLETRRATETDWSPDGVEELYSGLPSTMPQGFSVRNPMKFGLWLTYRFEFICEKSGDLERVITALSRLRKLERPGAERIAVDPEAQNDLVVNEPTGERLYEGIAMPAIQTSYDFDAHYLVVGLVSQGLLLPMKVADVIHHLWPIHPETRLAVLRALFRLERRQLVGSLAVNQVRNLLRGMPDPRASKTRKTGDQLPADRVSMRRVVVTPTRVLLFPPNIETGNRVLRAWPAQLRAGRFIRVGFGDEDGRIRINKKIGEADDINPTGGLLARIANALKNGVDVAGRHYVFLASGESQMKDHSCWMVCEDPDAGFTANRVREQMGDFSAERVVQKHAARMGLCFSATRHVAILNEEDIESLDDVKHGKYVFTDGVGNCSQDLAKRCAVLLGSEKADTSAVQIRMGGCKGVLSVHPHLEDNQVCIRPSMRKFLSSDRGLGVMKYAHHAPAHLNRQAIAVLISLGMNAHSLLDRFKAQIAHAENLENELRGLDTTRRQTRHVFKNVFIPVAKMIRAGLGEQTMLKNVLACIKCQLLRELKYKARIMVQDGAYLLGIADEYDVLEEGQIYCAVSPKGLSSRRVITGQCTIFRSPCLHPGDARLVTAVDHPAFKDFPLTDVVVFSVKDAPRDLPSMLGGGDLDGDFFTVIWDKELQITREHEPMDYTGVPPVKKVNITMDDVCDFFVTFVKSDVLGIVAHCWQAMADYWGPQHEYCLELAKYNSDAVDFPKSGMVVHIPDRLRPVRYPDFMDKGPEMSYPSPRVLGMMYRLIEPAPEYRPISDVCIDTRLTSRKVLSSYLKAAGLAKFAYDVEMEGIMRQHSLCEAEVIAGVSVMSDQKRRRSADDAIRGPVREGMENLRMKYRRQARQFVKENPSAKGMEEWALACYQITHVETLRTIWVDALNLSRRGSAAISDDGSDDEEYGEVERIDLISFPCA
ncbi:RNA dependent RNA polymerase-domain-containing protein [Roridomyces roridus]|uniref:RNA-dependent RNA polymerase n=1 Tax=Roridomyces roridus TaxID=1738132 RepID=A0AAD7BPQ9_9AGAR|nr:RNA dependent RNA polymerase-domain-containing protein [Roridomyces roridus]